jgi:drug/metabolite transporter (DMT)-like permease
MQIQGKKLAGARLAADSGLLIVAIVWGATFFMVKNATRDFPVLGFLALRFALATMALLPLVILNVRRWPNPAEWRWGVIAGIVLCLSYICQTFALRALGAGRTGFLTGLYVVLVPFLAMTLLRQRIVKRIWLGAGCAVTGLALLSGAPGGDLLGDSLALACAVLYAFQIIAVEQFPKDGDPRLMTAIQLGVVAVGCGILLPILASLNGCTEAVCTLLKPFADPIPASIPLPVLTTAAFTGFAASSVAISVQVWAQKILPPSEASLIYAMESPFSALFGVLFEHETLAGGALVGSTLMLIGMLITALGGSKIETIGATTPNVPSPPILEEGVLLG